MNHSPGLETPVLHAAHTHTQCVTLAIDALCHGSVIHPAPPLVGPGGGGGSSGSSISGGSGIK